MGVKKARQASFLIRNVSFNDKFWLAKGLKVFVAIQKFLI